MTYEAVPHTREPGAIDEPFMRLVAAMAGPRHEVAEADERSYREFIEALGVAVYTTDAAGRITFFNEAAVRLWGRRPALGEEWCGSWKLFWADGTPLPHDQCPMAIALKEDRSVRGMEAIAERPDGSRVSFIPYPTPLHDDAGRLVGAVNMLVDISERKRAEEQQALLVRELHHRVRNTLATVQAIMGSTARSSDTIEDPSAADGRNRRRQLRRCPAQRTRRLRRWQRQPHHADGAGRAAVGATRGVARHGDA
jgi:PAS domain S-box-containing protein